MKPNNKIEPGGGLEEEKTTVTPLSKYLTLILIFILPIIGFLIGRYVSYSPVDTTSESGQIITNEQSVTINTSDDEAIIDPYELNIAWQDRGEINPIELGFGNIENGIEAIYDVGYITNGPLADKRVYSRYQPEMAGSALYYFSVINGKILDLYDFPISGLPSEHEIISIQELGIKLVKFSYMANYPWEGSGYIKKTILNEPGVDQINLMWNECILSESPDGYTAFQYEYKLPFDTVTLNNGSDISISDYDYKDYSKYTDDISSPDCTNLTTVDQTLFWPEQRLSAAGKTGNGDTIYTLSNADDPLLKKTHDAYNQRLTRDNIGGFDRCDIDYTYSEFLKTNPILFWYDAFDRLIILTKNDFVNCLGQYKGG